MAKKFEPKELDGRGGLVATRHVVNMSDDTQLVLFSNPRAVRKGERDELIKDAKLRVLNRLSKQEGQIRRLMLDAVNELERTLLVADKTRGADGQARVKNVASAKKKVREIVGKAITSAGQLIESNVVGAVKTYTIAVNRSAGDLFNYKLSEINDLSTRTARKTLRERNQKGVNTTSRLKVLAKRMVSVLETQVSKSRYEREQGLSALKKQLVDPKGSHRSCIARGLSRINRTEQNRAMHSAVLSIMEEQNVEYAYWRLSASHRSYGGTEVCEVLASSSNTEADVPPSVSTTGLYRVDSFPQVPHPNCMCSIEPMFR